MNKWDRVEKTTKGNSLKSDIQWEYLKIVVLIGLGITYFYFIFWG